MGSLFCRLGTFCPSASTPRLDNTYPQLPSYRRIRNLISKPEIFQLVPRWFLTIVLASAVMRAGVKCSGVACSSGRMACPTGWGVITCRDMLTRQIYKPDIRKIKSRRHLYSFLFSVTNDDLSGISVIEMHF